ncbi:hypothetical protein F5884DRAFT_736462 [Xylogone sp. PMI_703]|nr:hypothetical protein F5884DRAFT_736462 [Xylogone sp. PMI_703]
MIVNHRDGAFVSEVFLVNTFDSHAPAKVFCLWRICRSPTDGDTSRYFRSLDLLLNILPASAHDGSVEEYLKIPNATGTALETLVRGTYGAIQGLANKAEIATKVILAPRDGYLCRSDILDMRMRHSPYVDAVISFSTWDRHLLGFSTYHQSTLLALLLSAAGALLVKQQQSSHHETLKLLQKDLEMRLSFDWVLPTKPTARRVAVVGGRYMYDATDNMASVRGYYEAAHALGISVIVLDELGHWLESEEYSHLYDEFIAVDMSNMTKLPHKVAEALRGIDIDGIVTFVDNYVIATAEAAEILGLPTEPAQAVLQAHYKHDMRKLVSQTNIQAVRIDTVAQLHDSAFAEKFHSLKYPLVVKPCRGQSSKGVRKVTNDSSMREAVCMLAEEDLADKGVLLETYVDGPEIDANFVLWDGQILFLEVTDNFPCQGDTNGTGFAETIMLSNSRLPPEEIEILRVSLHQSLQQLGFHSGVFHVEARMHNSSMQYQDTQGDGVVDLVISRTTGNGTTATTPSRRQDVFLIEVNTRPPGMGGTWSTMYTYGVDLSALHLLRALNDYERFKALSKPFSFSRADSGDGGGAQYWNGHCMLPFEGEKIQVPDDYFDKLYQTLPDIVPYMSRIQLYAHPGTVAFQSGGIGCIGYFLLHSRTSRRHLLEMYHRVTEASRKVLGDANGWIS